MPNQLAREKSPYLQQHADNPVEWYAWGPEPFERARREDKPLLISIGYSSCHWCHVMAHESFEDLSTARLMNELYVNVKVDREERPDVDAIYMEAIQAMTGHGGWPLSVFVTPDGMPFFGGTYFPPESRHGLPSWRDVLTSVSSAYQERPDDVARSAAGVTDYIRRTQSPTPSSDDPTSDVLSAAYASASTQFDWQNGGFGAAPKFPQPLGLNFILRMHRRLDEADALRFVETTLRTMAHAGIFDQLGGGFHRYSVDAQWVVPHFEKMLYDNALLVPVYLQAYQATREPLYRRVAEDTLDYLLREMRSPEGGFYSSQDADSEGEEGKFYVWTPEELFELLPAEQARAAALRYGIRPDGNFEGNTILTVEASHSEIARAMGLSSDRVVELLSHANAAMLEARSRRVPPGTDTKIITSWNALAITAFAQAGAILNRPDYLEVARTAASFLLTAVRTDSRLMRSYQDGPSAIPGFLEDYAYLVEALITLYETAFDGSHLENAQQLASQMLDQFWDEENGAFFDAARAEGELVVRPRGFYDNPIPSGNSSATFGLLRLEALTGYPSYGTSATPAFRIAGEALRRAPLGFSYLLSALDFHLSTPMQIAIAGRPESVAVQTLLREVFGRYLPNKVVAVGMTTSSPLLEGRDVREGEARAYLCRHFTCDLPAIDAATLAAQLDESRL